MPGARRNKQLVPDQSKEEQHLRGASSTAKEEPLSVSSSAIQKSTRGLPPRLGNSTFTADIAFDEIMAQFKSHLASNEELRRAVHALQDSSVLTEVRMTDLEHQWRHQEQVGSEPDESQAAPVCDLVDEVIAQLRLRAASHATSGAGPSSNAGHFVPGRVDNLAAYLRNVR